MRRGEVRAEGRSVGGRVSEEAKCERLEAKGGVSGGGPFRQGEQLADSSCARLLYNICSKRLSNFSALSVPSLSHKDVFIRSDKVFYQTCASQIRFQPCGLSVRSLKRSF